MPRVSQFYFKTAAVFLIAGVIMFTVMVFSGEKSASEQEVEA